MKISLAQIPVAQSQFEANLGTAAHYIENAKKSGSDLVVFPEMFLSGFHYMMNYNAIKNEPKFFIEKVCALAKANQIAICGTLPALDAGTQVNRFYYISEEGEVLAHYDKIHLFKIFNENKFIRAGDSLAVLETKFGKIGFATCYDLRFPEMFRKLALEGAEAFIVCAAWPHPRLLHWQTLLRARAIENQSFVIAVNQCCEENFVKHIAKYFGGSTIIDPWGETIIEAKIDSPDLVSAQIDLHYAEKIRKEFPSFCDIFFDKINH